MQRVRLERIGWDDDLRVEASAPPAPPTGRFVLVEVEACGVCHRDLIDRSGRFPFQQVPITPGHEAVGRVISVGPEVRDFRPGDRVATLHRDACGACRACASGETSLCTGAAFVLGILADGGYASHVMAPESALFAVPEAIPAAQAAIQHCTAGTAWRGLGNVSAGQRVLVTGANGGVGRAAVLLAKARGAEVIAVVRRQTELPADQVIVDDGSRFHKQVGDVDLALDCVGEATFNSSLRTLRVGGSAVAIGNISPARVALNLGYVITSALTLRGSSGATRKDMAALFAFGPPALPLEELPLAQADEAQRRLKAGNVAGRQVLRP
jgi:acryloyl-coenzyme A reductase